MLHQGCIDGCINLKSFSLGIYLNYGSFIKLLFLFSINFYLVFCLLFTTNKFFHYMVFHSLVSGVHIIHVLLFFLYELLEDKFTIKDIFEISQIVSLSLFSGLTSWLLYNSIIMSGMIMPILHINFITVNFCIHLLSMDDTPRLEHEQNINNMVN